MIKTFVLKSDISDTICRLVVEENNLFLYTPTGNYKNPIVENNNINLGPVFIVFQSSPHIHLFYYPYPKHTSYSFSCGLVYKNGYWLPTNKKYELELLKTLRSLLKND